MCLHVIQERRRTAWYVGEPVAQRKPRDTRPQHHLTTSLKCCTRKHTLQGSTKRGKWADIRGKLTPGNQMSCQCSSLTFAPSSVDYQRLLLTSKCCSLIFTERYLNSKFPTLQSSQRASSLSSLVASLMGVGVGEWGSVNRLPAGIRCLYITVRAYRHSPSHHLPDSWYSHLFVLCRSHR